jgi:hypothetical protein
MADAGVPVHVLSKIAGHGSLVTTQRHLDPDTQSIATAGTALSAHLTAKWSRMVPSSGSLRRANDHRAGRYKPAAFGFYHDQRAHSLRRDGGI